MAYTFGAATGDDITIAMNGNMGATTISAFVCGWWYPTTLTATRGLWSAGNVFGAEIDTTTSEIRLRTDNTTDGQWTTTGAGLTVNTWSFLAFANSCNNTGPASAWRVWAGTLETPPVELTVTGAVAPVGNFAGNASFYIGNKGTGTLAFQGDICEVSYHRCTAGTGVTTHPLTIATTGTITNDEARYIFERVVMPCWAGEVLPEPLRSPKNNLVEEAGHWSGLGGSQVIRRTRSTTLFSNALPTINGATISLNGHPRPTYRTPIYAGVRS